MIPAKSRSCQSSVKIGVSIATLGLLVTGFSCASSKPHTPLEYSNLNDSVATVVRRNANRWFPFCTGFNIGILPGGNGYYMMTAGHCVTADDVAVVYGRYEKAEALPAQFVRVGDVKKGDDYAILVVKTARKLPVLRLASLKREYLGAPVSLIGSPADLGKTLFIGIIQNLSIPSHAMDWTDWTGYFAISIMGEAGVSGSPVYSMTQGAVIGVMVGSVGKYAHIAIAMPVDRIMGAIRDCTHTGEALEWPKPRLSWEQPTGAPN